MISSPVRLAVSSIPIVCAREGELGSGESLGATFDEGWGGRLGWLSVEGDWPADEVVGLRWGPGDLADVPRKRAFLYKPSVSELGFDI